LHSQALLAGLPSQVFQRQQQVLSILYSTSLPMQEQSQLLPTSASGPPPLCTADVVTRNPH
jgi:hypothetical protein